MYLLVFGNSMPKQKSGIKSKCGEIKAQYFLHIVSPAFTNKKLLVILKPDYVSLKSANYRRSPTGTHSP
jgi:hypothetical protein